MNTKSKILGSLAAATLMVTQSGCLLGLVTLPFGFPLVAAGGGIALVGAGVTDYNLRRGDVQWATIGANLALYGAVLGEKNQGYVDGLNELPMDAELASSLGVKMRDFKSYNSHLNHIQEVARELQQDIDENLEYIQEKLLASFGFYDYKHDQKINEVAKKYGFRDASEMVDTISQQEASLEMVGRFAQSSSVDLTSAEARIMLQLVFKVKIQK